MPEGFVSSLSTRLYKAVQPLLDQKKRCTALGAARPGQPIARFLFEVWSTVRMTLNAHRCIDSVVLCS